MRLKENRDNWKASNVIRKLTVSPESPKYRNRKNTRKWCKGKPGREHDVYLVRVTVFDWWPEEGDEKWLEWECKTCSKQWYTTLQRYTKGTN